MSVDGGAHPVVVLWTTPRSRSTAFERMMIERGDVEVFDEPFSARYYFSSERRSPRYSETEPDSDAASIVGMLERASQERPVFVKDMAYHVTDLIDEGLLGRFVNAFLVREPTAAVASLARKWPDFTDEEAGYTSIGRAFDVACALGEERGDGPPPVLEADALATDPPSQIEAWCEAVGLPYRPEALTWAPGLVPQWIRWQDWYEGVADSTGFEPPRPGPPPSVEGARAQAVVRDARPVYERMAAHALG